MLSVVTPPPAPPSPPPWSCWGSCSYSAPPQRWTPTHSDQELLFSYTRNISIIRKHQSLWRNNWIAAPDNAAIVNILKVYKGEFNQVWLGLCPEDFIYLVRFREIVQISKYSMEYRKLVDILFWLHQQLPILWKPFKTICLKFLSDKIIFLIWTEWRTPTDRALFLTRPSPDLL